MSTPTLHLLLALAGCNPTETLEVDIVQEPPAEVGMAAAALAPDHIHTARTGDPVGLARVLEIPLPEGRPILRDCDGMLGSLSPAAGGPSRFPLLMATGCGSANEPAAAPALDVAEPAPAPPPADPAAAPVIAPVEAEPLSEPEPIPDLVDPFAGGRPAGDSKDNTRASGPARRTSNREVATERSDQPAKPAQPAARDKELLAQLGYLEEVDEDGEAEEAEVLDELAKNEQPKAKKTADRRQAEEKRVRPREPVYEWGKEVFLSNDDSMSLASAQRVLYAVGRGVALSPSEIRPHELLNYFSFDTAAPQDDRTFGVLGSARQDGDKLALSLAVRGANPPRKPLDLTVVIDRSGSMASEGKMAYTKRGLRKLVDNLQRGDRIDIVLFDSEICTPVEGLVIGRDRLDPLYKVVENMEPRSATDLSAGLNEAYRIQTSRSDADVHGRNRRVLLITDAELNSGNVDESLVSEVGRNLEEHGVKLSGIGVGREFNDRMLDMLTEKGQGAYVYLGSEAVVDRIFGPGFDSLVRTVAHDVKFSLELPDSLAMARFYGEESSTVAAEVKPIHYHAGTTQLFLQDLALREGRVVGSDPITMKIAFHDPTGEPVTEELRTTVGALLDADPHNVDKGRALMAFSDWVLAGAMRADPCGDALEAYLDRSALLSDDAEIGYVDGLVRGRCPNAVRPVSAPTVELRLKIDSDDPVSAAGLECGDLRNQRDLSPSQSVIRFDARPGRCRLELRQSSGALLPVNIEVSRVGSEVRCLIRGGRASCG